jgi:molybdopterin synthase sulfur carrier subunit
VEPLPGIPGRGFFAALEKRPFFGYHVSMIKVLFFATIRDYTREKETVAEGSGTVGDLLLELSDRYGGEFRDEAFDGDTISDRVIVLVNGRHIATPEERKPVSPKETPLPSSPS